MRRALEPDRRVHGKVLGAGTEHTVRQRLPDGGGQIASAGKRLLARRAMARSSVSRVAPGNAAAISRRRRVGVDGAASGNTVTAAISALTCAQ